MTCWNAWTSLSKLSSLLYTSNLSFDSESELSILRLKGSAARLERWQKMLEGSPRRLEGWDEVLEGSPRGLEGCDEGLKCSKGGLEG